MAIPDTPARAGHPPVHFMALDALRFILACIVVLSHILPLSSPLPRLLKSAAFVGLNGAWAVMAFFVVSGLCIHLPQARGRALVVRSFYLARFCRIVIPMLAAVLIALPLPHGLENLGAVLWSLYCEIAYYALYPLLLRLFGVFGILRCLAAAFILALAMTLVPDHHEGFFWAYGTFGTMVLGLPVWILGCVLAELLLQPSPPAWVPRWGVASLRILMVLSGGALRALHIATPFKLKYSLILMSPLCALWLMTELRQGQVNAVLMRLAPLGSASYSLYLTHKLAPSLVAMVLPAVAVEGFEWWVVALAFAGALAWMFYTLVERPCHRLARRASQSLRPVLPQPQVPTTVA